MQYKYEFEIAACVVMIIILIHCFFVKQYPTKKAKIFLALLGASIAECVFNVTSAIGLANADVVPQMVNELLAFAFFAAEGVVSYLLFYYIILMCDFELKHRRWTFVFANLPFLFFEIMVVLTPFIGFFYYFEDNQYHQGFGAEFGYCYIGYYYIFNFIILMVQRKKIEPRLKSVLFFYTFCAILTLLVQHAYRGLILTGTANALIVFLMYLTMQNPGEYLDISTGNGNANALKLQMQQMMEKRTPFVVYSVELKNFSRIQELFGEENGEMLLIEIGRYLTNLCGYLHAFHHKEETFELLLPKGEEGAILETIKQRFNDSWKIRNNYIYVTVCTSVQRYPEDFTEVPEFFSQQGYLFKHARKRSLSIVEANDGLLEKFRRRTEVEAALKRAIENEKLEVYFQPIYSLKEKRIVSLEALMRLNDEVLGFVPPDEFIPLAEKDGSILKLGEIVLEECCRFLSKRILSNDSLDIQTIQINISVVQCMQQNLKEKIMPVLDKYHIPPSMITLEITESTQIQAYELMLRQMQELNEVGIYFAADDYGTGNSNFSYLVNFPFREIKIDKNMTWAYFENASARVIIENEIRTMQKLGLPVVVEGIETKEQSDAMEALGVPYIQGYYYGKPMPEKECLRYLRQFAEQSESYGR